MKTKKFLIFFLLPLTAFSQQSTVKLSDLVVAEPIPVLVSKEFKFTEGPSPDKKGNIFFTDQPNDKIWKYDTEGKFSVFVDKTGRSNGTYFDKKDNLITCADEKGQILSINRKGKITVLLNDLGGKQLNGPNDLWIDKKGGIYFTDPYYQREYWTRKKSDLDGQRVYYLAKGAQQPTIIASDLTQPNGILGTPDGKAIFIADIKGNKTYKYSINPDGTLSNKQLFASQGSDGMTMDASGNIYFCSTGGVHVYDPEGKKIGMIPVRAGWTANACFGGKDRDILFITASDSVFTLKMKVRGVE